ncbi:MAG: hypothetical protein WCG16_05085 [Methylococcales bacterium]
MTGSFFFNPDIIPILNGEFTAIFKGDNAAKDVISWNLHRRHLNESQRAMVAAKLANLPAHRPSYKSANLPTSSSKDLLCPACEYPYFPSNEICHVCGYDLVKDYIGEKESRISQQEAAQMLNVSERSLRTAKKVEQNAIPEIIEKVDIKNLSKPDIHCFVTNPMRWPLTSENIYLVNSI